MDSIHQLARDMAWQAACCLGNRNGVFEIHTFTDQAGNITSLNLVGPCTVRRFCRGWGIRLPGNQERQFVGIVTGEDDGGEPGEIIPTTGIDGAVLFPLDQFKLAGASA